MDEARSADVLKQRGNQYFAEGDYKKAQFAYLQAISHTPDNVILRTNRALSSLKLHDYEECERDARKGIELDRKSVKSHFYLGKCLMETKNYNAALKSLQTAFELSKETQQTKQFADELFRAYFGCKKRQWLSEQEERRGLLADTRDWIHQMAMDKLQSLKSGQGASSSAYEKIESENNAKLSILEAVLLADEEKERNKEVPDPFNCPITMDIMVDPVVTPSGQSYERSAIIDHLERCGPNPIDPVSRKPIPGGVKSIITNLQLRQAIELYFNQHPWAFPDY